MEPIPNCASEYRRGEGQQVETLQNSSAERATVEGHSIISDQKRRPSATGGVSQAWLLIVILVAVPLRIIATKNDLWLDELISLRVANTVKTPWQIVNAVHNDNNHYLNTLYLYVLGIQNYAPLYRYLSVVFGVALVGAGYWLLARRSRVEGLILTALLACSYPLIHFSSEARGYAGALLGTMLACGAVARWMAGESRTGRLLFLGSVYAGGLVLAMLSHLTACLIWFPLAAGSLIMVAGRAGRKKWITEWVAFNALPVAVLAVLYFLDLRFLTELGGSPMSMLHGLGRLLALGLGWPGKDGATVWIIAVPLTGGVAWQLMAERKAGEPLWILFTLIYATAVGSTLVMRPTFFSPRYFLVILPFVYAGLAMLLARWAQNPRGRIALAAVFLVFLAGQAQLYSKFMRVGRGQFTAALQFMAAHTTSSDLRVASNQDFRSRVELAYYVPRVLGKRQLWYGPAQGQGSFQPDWYILHQEGYEEPGPAVLKGPSQTTWCRAAYFGASELSGQAWTIYSRQPVQ